MECLFIYFINIISRKKQNEKMVSIKRLEKTSFSLNHFQQAEVKMGPKCAKAAASLSARPEEAVTENKMEDVHALS